MTKTNHKCKIDIPETIPTEDRILSFLGLATRAGKTIAGTDASVLAVSLDFPDRFKVRVPI